MEYRLRLYSESNPDLKRELVFKDLDKKSNLVSVNVEETKQGEGASSYGGFGRVLRDDLKRVGRSL